MIWFKAAIVVLFCIVILSGLGRANRAEEIGELYKGAVYAVVFTLLLLTLTIAWN